jgi:hypothetical protein
LLGNVDLSHQRTAEVFATGSPLHVSEYKPCTVWDFLKQKVALRIALPAPDHRLESNVVKRKDGKHTQQTLWYKILNPAYTQKTGRQEFFQRQ